MLIKRYYNVFPPVLWSTGDDGGSGGSGDPGTTGSGTGGDGGNGGEGGGNNDAPTADDVRGLKTALHTEREARKAAEKTLKDLQRNALPEGERLKAENEELKNQISTLNGKISTLQLGGTVEEKARELGFTKPARALKALQVFTDVDITSLDSADKVEKALKDLAESENDLVSTPPPSGGPINPASGQSPAGNAGFNAAIRARAGRA